MAFLVRIETDMLGSRELPKDAYYGIHALRASENFPITGQPMHREMIRSLGWIKKACAMANHKAGLLDGRKAEAMQRACDEVITGKLDGAFIVDRIQGGAGTSANMNANEVIANRAIELLGGEKGDYTIIHPNDHVNCGQSTNDVYPSCGKLALYCLSDELLHAVDRLVQALKAKAEAFDHVVKMGRTQLQDAVPIRLGQEFAAYAAVMSREHMRIDRARQEMLSLNLGATAIGTKVNAHPVYIRNVYPMLSQLTGLPVIPCEDLIDGTQNLDAYIALSSAFKNCAVSLSKICNDLRLMSSGPQDGLGEITLPPRQNGSSIMPGKVNPVIPEVVNQIAFRVIGFDHTVTMAVEAGQLELNAFEPVIFDSLIQGCEQLTHGVETLTKNCIQGIVANERLCRSQAERSAGMATALCTRIGYAEACKLAKEALATHRTLKELVVDYGILSSDEAEECLDPMLLTRG